MNTKNLNIPPEVKKEYDELIELCEKNFTKKDTAAISEIFTIIWNCRDTEDPYNLLKIKRSLKAAKIIPDIMNDIIMVQATLLLRSFKKGYINENDVKPELAQTVKLIKSTLKLSEINTKKIILGKSGLKKLKDKRGEERNIAKQNENLIKLLLSYSNDVRAIIVRLVVRLAVVKTIDQLPEEIRKDIGLETTRVHAPVAHRLGLYKLKTDLEEFSMKNYAYPIYKNIAKKLDSSKEERNNFIEHFIGPIREILKNEGFEFEIKGRPKSIYSIWTKMKKQGVPFEKVYDLFAIRIILKKDYKDIKEEKNDCWQVYSRITDIYEPKAERLRDWVSKPKKYTGYESLHTTVITKEKQWVEIQIRTQRMDYIAEKGQAAHWKYKENGGGNVNSLDLWLSKIRENFENSEIPEKTEEEFTGEIFVFTPKKELKKITAGGTVLDFAFSVHTKVGMTCIGAKINGEIKSISDKLKNGDVVEILTNKNKTPSLEWINIVQSKKAKAKIKKFFQEKQYKNVNEGKEILKHKCEQLKRNCDENIYTEIRQHYTKYNTSFELLEAIGKGEIDSTELKEMLAGNKTEEDEKTILKVEDYLDLSEEKEEKKDFIVIDKLGSLDFNLAKCCNPVRGDEVFGFITVSKGTKIHKSSCPNAKDMKRRYPYRIVEAKWTNEDTTNFYATIEISGSNQNFILNKIFDKITKDLKIKIKDIKDIDEKKGFKCKIKIQVKDTKQLEKTILQIKEIKGILNVKRV